MLLARRHWGYGFMSEAVTAVVDWALAIHLFFASALSAISTISARRACWKELASSGRAFYARGRFIGTFQRFHATATRPPKSATPNQSMQLTPSPYRVHISP